MRIRFNSYGPSNSVNALVSALVNSTLGRQGISSGRLASNLEASVFRGREDDLIINWGSSRLIPERVTGQATVLNHPSVVNQAANKITALTMMSNAGVSTVEFTTDGAAARTWVEDGEKVFCRHELRGHSGEGIVVVANEVPEDLGNVEYMQILPEAPLYTKGVNGTHREYRIHVFKGQVLFTQQKRRVSGYRDLENYSNVVRNHGNGWIYSHVNMTAPIQAVYDQAIAAVQALGLDFGAVDIISQRNNTWVLEVNTAPGVSGETTLEKYVEAIVDYVSTPEEAVTLPVDVLEERVQQHLEPTTTLSNADNLSNWTVVAGTNPFAPEIFDVGAVPGEMITIGSGTAAAVPVPPAEPVVEFVNAQSVPAVGDQVRIRPSSNHYGRNGANPMDVTGHVSSIISFNESDPEVYVVRVTWPNGRGNNYRLKDLMVVATEATTATQADVTQYEVGAYYIVQLENGTRKVGEWCPINKGFWDTTMQLMRAREVTVIREVELND